MKDRKIRSSNIDNSKAYGDTNLLYVEIPKYVKNTHPYVFSDLQERLGKMFDESVFLSKK